MFGLGKLFYVILFAINGIAVLSEDRFLNRIGWGSTPAGFQPPQYQQYGQGLDTNDNGSMKSRIINLISAVRTLLRIPLILINVLVILYEVVFG